MVLQGHCTIYNRYVTLTFSKTEMKPEIKKRNAKNRNASGDVTHTYPIVSHTWGIFYQARGYVTQAAGIFHQARGYVTQAAGIFYHTSGYVTQADPYVTQARGSVTLTYPLYRNTNCMFRL